MVKLLLTDQIVNPADHNNFAIRWASKNGHANVVERLLNDDRVNPTASANYAIRKASDNGHIDVVKLLLNDSRVNPADKNNLAIYLASKSGHVDVVKILLNDGRVNPADQKNPAIYSALGEERIDVVNLLRQSQRALTLLFYKSSNSNEFDDYDYLHSVSPNYVLNLSFFTNQSNEPICDLQYPANFIGHVEKVMKPYLYKVGLELSEIHDLPEDVIRHCILTYMVGFPYE